MATGVVNANGQNHICSNSKAYRISEWVNSVDTSYAPSEQGSCISANVPRSHAGSDEFNQSFGDFPTTNPYCRAVNEQSTTERALTRPHSRKRVKNQVRDNNVRIHSGQLPQLNQKDSYSHDVSITANNNVSKNSKQVNKTASSSSTVHTPFSPLSHHPTVLGVNSDKTDTGQKLQASTSAYQEEDMQLDSQVSFNSLVTDNYQAQQTELDNSTDIAMEIDNYEEFENQIKLEVRLYDVSVYIIMYHYISVYISLIHLPVNYM